MNLFRIFAVTGIILSLTGCTQPADVVDGNYNMDGNWLVSGSYVYQEDGGFTQEGTVADALVTIDQIGDRGTTLNAIVFADINKLSLAGESDQFLFAPFIRASTKTSGYLQEGYGEVEFKVRLAFLGTDGEYHDDLAYKYTYQLTEIVPYNPEALLSVAPSSISIGMGKRIDLLEEARSPLYDRIHTVIMQ